MGFRFFNSRSYLTLDYSVYAPYFTKKLYILKRKPFFHLVSLKGSFNKEEIGLLFADTLLEGLKIRYLYILNCTYYMTSMYCKNITN